MAFDEVGVLGHGVAQHVEKRGLQSGERVVVPLYPGVCEVEGLGVALPGQPVDYRAARVGKPHDLGALVEGFARGVVDRRADDLHVERGVHAHDLRMPAADEQAQEREVGVGQRTVREVDEVGEDVPLEVVDLDHRDVAGDGEALGERHAHEQRPDESGAAREGDGVDVGGREPGVAQGGIHHGNDVLLVGAGSQFGNHAAVFDVHGL